MSPRPPLIPAPSRWRRALALLVALGLPAPAVAATPLPVFVSVLPLATFVERVGGERVVVQVLVPPGRDPHSYEPTPKQVAALSATALMVRAGMPYEAAWMPRIQSANAGLEVLDLRDGLPLRRMEAHEHEHEHEHGRIGHEHDNDNDKESAGGKAAEPGHGEEFDPHIWTSPRLVRQMAEAIRDTLTRLDPEGAAVYASNQAAFDAELAALDQELAARLANLDNRSFLVYHPAWGYFADAYGLTQVPIEHQGKEPGPRSLVALIEQARAVGTHVIFVQPQFNQRVAGQVATEIDGRVETVDPLAADYADNLRRVAALIAAANGGKGSAPVQP